MTERRRVLEQVLGILTENGLRFTADAGNDTFFVPEGSSGVHVKVNTWGDDTAVVLTAHVLDQVDSAGERRQAILEELNRHNRDRYFNKLYLVDEPPLIVLQQELLGSELDGEELMNALRTVAFGADELDDELIATLGTGRRWSDAEPPPADADPGPVVDA
jgi:hypothetical protein